MREILDSIIKQESDYKWEIRDGVVNIYPARAKDEILRTFLDTKIKNFSSKKES